MNCPYHLGGESDSADLAPVTHEPNRNGIAFYGVDHPPISDAQLVHALVIATQGFGDELLEVGAKPSNLAYDPLSYPSIEFLNILYGFFRPLDLSQTSLTSPLGRFCRRFV